MIIDIDGEHVFDVPKVGMFYSVRCLSPEAKKGYLGERESNYHMEDGSMVYKHNRYFLLSSAVYAMEEYAGLHRCKYKPNACST